MQETRFFTVLVPKLGTDATPPAGNVAASGCLIAYANDQSPPLRVLVRNISEAIDVTLSFSDQALTQVPPMSGVFVLPAGTSEVFPIAPGQRIHASTAGDGVQVSVCISDALPADLAPAPRT